MKTIFFTGGGSGGHAISAITIINKIKHKPNLKIQYIGSYDGIEKKLVNNINIEYKAILTGKLRRYISFKNLVDIFKVFLAIFQVLFFLMCKKNKDSLLFSTGGFVSVPPVIAASLLKIPVYVHEQTSRIGLANLIASKFAFKVFISFEETKKFLPPSKTIFSGYPVRDECYQENIILDKIKGIKLKEIEKPILFVTGGGNGSDLVNRLLEKNLNILKQKFFIIHQAGINHLAKYQRYEDSDYMAIDFVDNIIDIFKLSCVVISRSGAGTVAEMIALGKPSIFIPLKIAQKNEQYHNAMAAQKILGSIVIEEDRLNDVDILSEIDKIYKIANTKIKTNPIRATDFIIEQILR
ncbi:MAG: hypothetical protein A2381_19585 [Bdellovibrionales bacterium RIFOXYB1_FULL_37_110]|nr:MAG: hypothetical protein A2417_11085 [Bdellovibrionales bacterium RIFOXYC1_FULL_37_79]OFZ60682.1 MAG: hypothetical protein A2381_19585 [Bdellovibrionales bacterium RIFOXYB1_FULL_37_110]OFZ64434.1 MAG: hypothetical protein A2577_10235 [Bdellovibrionales bacterium RIFOXYD1_FULL_36_51]